MKFSVLYKEKKFAILDEIWTKSGQLTTKKYQNVIEFDIVSGKKCHSFTFIGLNQWMPKMIPVTYE